MPMVVIGALQALYGIIDMAIAGNYVGNGGLSGINNSGQIVNLITQILLGICTGGNVLIAQRFGMGDHEGRQKAAGTLLSVSIIGGLIIVFVILFFSENLLYLIDAPAFEEAYTYLVTCTYGLVFVFGYNAIAAILRAVGNSKIPMQIMIISVCVNIALDFLFMGPMQMGVFGAALATVIAQGLSFFISLIYVIRNPEAIKICFENLKIRKSEFLKIFKIGIPCALQWAIAGLSWLTVTTLVNSYGVDVSAGAGVAAKIKDFCQLFIAAFANSASAMIAQTLGAKMYDRALQIMYTAMKICIITSIGIIIFVQLTAPFLASFFADEPEVIKYAVMNLRIEIFGQIFYALFFVYHSLATGAGHTLFIMCSSFVNCILFRVILAYVFNHFFGLWGVFLACAIAPYSSVPICQVYVKLGKWKTTLSK